VTSEVKNLLSLPVSKYVKIVVRKFIRKSENIRLNFERIISTTQEDVKIFTVNIMKRSRQEEVYQIGLYLKMEPQLASKTRCFNDSETHLRHPHLRNFSTKDVSI
jgi:hypothetical protein